MGNHTEIPDNLPGTFAVLPEVSVLAQDIVNIADDCQQQHPDNVNGLAWTKAILDDAISQLRFVSSEIGDKIHNAMAGDRFYTVEGMDKPIESRPTRTWDNKAWDKEAIEEAIAERILEAWEEGEVDHPMDAARLATRYALDIGGSTLRIGGLESAGIDPRKVGSKIEKRPSVSIPKITEWRAK